jgi:hypothetical protein
MSAWITKSEVAQITGWTARHIERQASIGDLASLYSPGFLIQPLSSPTLTVPSCLPRWRSRRRNAMRRSRRS